MDSVFLIRPLEEGDLGFFLEVRNECRTFLDDDREYSLEQSVTWFHNQHPKFFIIELGPDRIGYFRTANWNKKNNSVWIGADLHKNFRGKKLAKKAYRQFLENLSSEHGFETFYLNVLEDNFRAKNLYKSLGFEELPVPNNVVIRSGGKKHQRIRMRLEYDGQ